MFKQLLTGLLLTGFSLHGEAIESSHLNNTINTSWGCHHSNDNKIKKFENIVVSDSIRGKSLRIRDDARIEGDLRVGESVVVGENLQVVHNGTVGGNLDVGGSITATGSIFAPSFVTSTGIITPVQQAYGKLYASATIGQLIITNPQGLNNLPQNTGWQPFPVDTFSTSLNTTAATPTNATITVQNAGTYLVNASLCLKYPTPGSDGPTDLSGYSIAVKVNGALIDSSINELHISTEGSGENPGLLFGSALSDLVTVDANSTIQFVISGSTGTPHYMNVAAANGTVVQVGG